MDKPVVWVFPVVSACLDCGAAICVVPERELKVLRPGKPIEGAAIALPNSKKNGSELSQN